MTFFCANEKEQFSQENIAKVIIFCSTFIVKMENEYIEKSNFCMPFHLLFLGVTRDVYRRMVKTRAEMDWCCQQCSEVYKLELSNHKSDF